MKFSGTVIAVNDMEVSKKFYQEVLHQKVVFDIGVNVAFEGNLCLQLNYAELVGFNKEDIVQDSKNFELYFEEEDLDAFRKHLDIFSTIKYLHDTKEYPWGQRVIRFFDPDQHIVEVAESMEIVIKRFLKQGLSVEETAERTMYPIEYIKSCL